MDVQGFQSLGQNAFTDLVIAPTTHQFNFNGTKILSKHTVKFGMDYRKFMLNFTQLFFPSGQYGFSNAQWTQRDPNVTSSTQGFALASMLLGVPSFGQISHNPDPASASSYWASYIQDDWKLTRNLTLNVGLRYEFDVPRTERFDRLSYFDQTATSPIANLVPANAFFNPRDLQWRPGLHGRKQPPPGRDRPQQLWPARRPRLQRLAEDRHPLRVRGLLHAVAPAGCRTFGLRRDDGLQQPDQHDRQPRRPDSAADDRQSVPRRLQPAAGQFARRCDVHGAEHRRRQRRCVHDERHAPHAAMELQRAARAAGKFHRRARVSGQQGHEPARRRERAGVLAARSVVPGARHGASGSGAESLLRDHHQSFVAAAIRRRCRATGSSGRSRSTTASARSACQDPRRSTTP